MAGTDVKGCLACDLSNGREDLPGGRIYATDTWVVEHCVGPFGVGTLIVKPIRHCLHVGNLTAREAEELGPLLQQTTSVIQALADADQVYVCLWSFAGWQPGHVHFVLQPVHTASQEYFEHPGPCHQRDMLHAEEPLPREAAKDFADRARRLMQQTS